MQVLQEEEQRNQTYILAVDNLVKNTVILFAGFAIALILFECNRKTVEMVEVETIITRVDTVFREQSPQPVLTLPRTVIDTVKVYDSVRVYQGRKEFNNGFIDYEFRTLGYLDSYEFRPTIFIPETTITRTIMQEKPRLYALASVGISNYSVGALYVRKKAIYGYSYNPTDNQHSFSVGVRLF